ncbi:MAG: hypothetical protein JRI41_02940 [Deltaproteobacteria bacterium]|nr:hypothetical protein [Deltaproteobacteria bacterium]
MTEEKGIMSDEVFHSKEACLDMIGQKGLHGLYEVIGHEGGGWVAVPKRPETTTQVAKRSRPTRAPKKAKQKSSSLGKLVKCRVYRSNVDPDNRDMPISVCVNSLANKKIFWPGEEVELHEAHINVLKDSVEETRILIPPESGVYASKDPLSVAQGFYPNMTGSINSMDNMITMTSRIPNYLVEVVS